MKTKSILILLVLLVWAGTAQGVITVTGSSGATPITPTTSGNYTIYSYTTTGSGTFTISPSSASLLCDILIVGGGGGGGVGGGGAGGFIDSTLSKGISSAMLLSGSYDVAVGAGGVAVSGNTATGGNSSFGSIIAAGGGQGGWSANNLGVRGGCGGGAGVCSSTVLGGASVLSQGNSGGTSLASGGYTWVGAGGGGAGGVGYNALLNSSTAGAGGPGLSSAITGTATYYAGGGGGGDWSSSYYGATGGTGGGGNGASNGSGTAGVNGKGGGGGGGTGAGQGGAGGSGIVIIRFFTAALTNDYDPGKENVLNTKIYLNSSSGTQQGEATSGMTVSVGTATISGGTLTALSLTGGTMDLTTTGSTAYGTLATTSTLSTGYWTMNLGSGTSGNNVLHGKTFGPGGTYIGSRPVPSPNGYYLPRNIIDGNERQYAIKTEGVRIEHE